MSNIVQLSSAFKKYVPQQLCLQFTSAVHIICLYLVHHRINRMSVPRSSSPDRNRRLTFRPGIAWRHDGFRNRDPSGQPQHNLHSTAPAAARKASMQVISLWIPVTIWYIIYIWYCLISDAHLMPWPWKPPWKSPVSRGSIMISSCCLYFLNTFVNTVGSID